MQPIKYGEFPRQVNRYTSFHDRTGIYYIYMSIYFDILYCIVYFYYSDMYKQIQWQYKYVYNIVFSPSGLISHSKMYVVKKNIYAERNSQKSTLLHNIVNPSKHQERPNVGAVPASAEDIDQHWTNTEWIPSQQTRDTSPAPDQW